MAKKFFMLLLSIIIILCITSSVTFACSENVSSQKFFVNYSHASSRQAEHKQSVIDTARSSRNFIAVLTKPDGARILEHIKFTRTVIFSEKLTSIYNFSQSPKQSYLSSIENKVRRIEIHQDIQQRK